MIAKKCSYLIFSVRWRKNILLSLLFGRKEEEFYFSILEDPLREVDKEETFFFLPLLFSERRILKKFPSTLSKKRVGYKKIRNFSLQKEDEKHIP